MCWLADTIKTGPGQPCPRLGTLPALAAGVLIMGTQLIRAQTDQGYIIRTAPYPVFSQPEPAQYNLKWGNLTARLRASAQLEFNDNLNLSEDNPEADLGFGPDFGIGFLLPVTVENVLQLDFGIGYRWYLNHADIQSLKIAPNSRFDYRIFIRDVRINVHDAFTVQVDPISRPDLGGEGRVENFRRLNNVAGLIAEWRPVRPLGLIAGYDYTIDRSLSGEFTSLDRDSHTFLAGAQYTVSPRLTVGLNGSYSTIAYLERVQNDGVSWSIGPILNYELSSFITIDASAGYSVSTFADTGTIGDTSDFSGFAVQLGVRHMINRRMSQDLRLRKGAELGLGSNYNDLLSVQHGVTMELTSAITLHSRFVYEYFTASMTGGETANRYLYYLGTAYQLTRLWSVGAAYSFSWKDSDQTGRDYRQNRLTFELARKF